uniref:Sugar phosphate transporter domain-containing protein n=1 Tax=Chromera velia CCMP2878 TaxID=1169474 RepID=A0A0G4HI31_9ALVE|eukprot:Cvel_6908.t1-p1 / transcript=Cvel_6908.t1 / gene=Cvel_6908 / organism=Chromera_velia_CCMP2878 / gene_product=Solute carrier family 35 member B1, putative / transcript_product=Solute carrier family 35 member B1, putative / location=Cvel_scaffold349:67681-68883(-) / protein_length=401 / sequence_SO=supercontig / SO=protein_coding / is_pseudo=false
MGSLRRESVSRGGSREECSPSVLPGKHGRKEETADTTGTWFSVLSVFGIYIGCMSSAAFQEAVYHVGKGDGDVFRYPATLLFGLCVFSSTVSFAWNAVVAGGRLRRVFQFMHQPPKTDWQEDEKDLSSAAVSSRWRVRDYFVLIGCSQMGSTLASNCALNLVNLPTQVLVKSAKMIPITLGSWLCFRKVYPLREYLLVVCVTAAVITFNVARMKTNAEAQQTMLGLVLCLLSLACDGATGPFQDKVNHEYRVSPTEHMMLTYGFATIPAGVAIVLLDGDGGLLYVLRRKETLPLILGFYVCNAVGQYFWFHSITHFGALRTALITTTRKMATVLFSIFWFNHQIVPLQWVSMAVVFGAVLLAHTRKMTRGSGGGVHWSAQKLKTMPPSAAKEANRERSMKP